MTKLCIIFNNVAILSKKWYLNVHVTMQRQNGVDLKESASYFKSKTYTLLDVNDSLNDEVDNAYQSLYKHFGSVQ